jgi:hypothetical protein
MNLISTQASRYGPAKQQKASGTPCLQVEEAIQVLDKLKAK